MWLQLAEFLLLGIRYPLSKVSVPSGLTVPSLLPVRISKLLDTAEFSSDQYGFIQVPLFIVEDPSDQIWDSV